jgi:hypothetical protein
MLIHKLFQGHQKQKKRKMGESEFFIVKKFFSEKYSKENEKINHGLEENIPNHYF